MNTFWNKKWTFRSFSMPQTLFRFCKRKQTLYDFQMSWISDSWVTLSNFSWSMNWETKIVQFHLENIYQNWPLPVRALQISAEADKINAMAKNCFISDDFQFFLIELFKNWTLIPYWTISIISKRIYRGSIALRQERNIREILKTKCKRINPDLKLQQADHNF